MPIPVTKKINLESLITKEELEQLKDIRLEKIPKPREQIGEGTSGDVFLFKFEDGSIRAGKKPKINLSNKSAKEEECMKKQLSSVLGELKMLHQLSHDRVIKFFGFYLDRHQVLIFMETMRGSVKDEINNKKNLSEMEAMNYFTQAAEGLAYLHSRTPRAIVHRDIKGENLLLTTENNVKLADFGLAVDLAMSSGSVSTLPTAPTPFAGKYYFVAPEILGKMLQPEAYDRESDVWSLACTLVQMISGQPPYGNLSFIEFIQRSSNASQNPLTYTGDLLPTASNAIKWLLNCLFTSDSKLRPSAELVLSLAYDVTQKAAKQGNATAQYCLGVMYKEGRGVPQSDEDACEWYGNAAEQGHADGQNSLGFMYHYGRGIPQSDDEAVDWYRKAAEQGNVDGQKNLGEMFQYGRGVAQSDEEAVNWYKKAADHGNASAQNNLGFMYLSGRGVLQSDEEAAKWYRKAAEQGNASAQYNLGCLYHIGRGVPRSHEEAIIWYRRAAEGDNERAKLELGTMSNLYKRFKRLIV